MSDELRKRQRIEDREVNKVSEHNFEGTKSRFDMKDDEILTLKNEINSLSTENSKLNSYISRFSSSLAMVGFI